ncbi:conserved hypothetical protein [Shewanella halifaxensis HAW-EB4]|uniref:Uncharacterized protein n=1 Tax=Shewanella halifaxensis (strain HAW-EB4) TaxID=458817 RepID=B0TSU1_SHEHH|nr:hypothetical protein [Shewanella halifaxensis]ABZ75266.1 conserved hypothetical protein [Shewanella halifaxensis HAW-EB4]
MESLVDFIRLLSEHGRLATANQVIAIAGLELEIDDPEAAYLKLVEDIQYKDIKLMDGDSQSYFYSDRYIVDSYAKQWLGVNEGKLAFTMAEYIRRYSALGELVPEDNFSHAPYSLSTAELKLLPTQLGESSHCNDIAYQKGKDGAGYYYSLQHITSTYAQVLANHDPFEWSV